jgi:hypothetical protein
MNRWLVAGLLAEDESDHWFLGPVIQRQLEDFSRQARLPFDVPDLLPGGCTTIRPEAEVAVAVMDLAADCDVIFVHHDAREQARIEQLRGMLTMESGQVVPVIPVWETEAWIIADRMAVGGLRGACADGLPPTPKAAERLRQPKIALDAALPSRTGHGNLEDWFRLLGQRVRLDVLACVPAYAQWRAETEAKLKELRFL